MPGPGGYPAAPPPRKSRGGRIALLVVIPLLLVPLCCVGGFVAYHQYRTRHGDALVAAYEKLGAPTGFTASEPALNSDEDLLTGAVQLKGWDSKSGLDPVGATYDWLSRAGYAGTPKTYLAKTCYTAAGCKLQFTVDKQKVTARLSAMSGYGKVEFRIGIRMTPPGAI